MRIYDGLGEKFLQEASGWIRSSYMRDPGQSWSLGFPCAHLKYFLQFSGFGNSSPSLEQDVLRAVDKVKKLKSLRTQFFYF